MTYPSRQSQEQRGKYVHASREHFGLRFKIFNQEKAMAPKEWIENEATERLFLFTKSLSHTQKEVTVRRKECCTIILM